MGKIKNIIMLASLLLLIALISSCKSRSSDALPELDYRAGSSGITIKYLTDITPSQIDEGETFILGMKVTNEGAADVDVVNFVLSGYNSAYFPTVDPREIPQFSMKGKSKYDPVGEEKILTFNIKNLKAPTENYEAVFLSTVCYKYKTIATTDICIVTDVAELTKLVKPPCTAKSSISLSSQGAPVTVTKVEPNIYKDRDILKADFKIYIDNKGKGNVRLKESFDKECTGSSALKKEDINNVSVKVYLGNEKICEGSYMIKKQGLGEKTDNYYKCSTIIQQNIESYLTFLKVDLDYGYVQTESKKIKVKKPTD